MLCCVYVNITPLPSCAWGGGNLLVGNKCVYSSLLLCLFQQIIFYQFCFSVSNEYVSFCQLSPANVDYTNIMCVPLSCDHSWSFVQTPKTEMKHMAQSGNMIWPKEWASCIWIWSGCVAAAATSDRGWYVVSGQMCSFHCMLTPSSFIELNISKWMR